MRQRRHTTQDFYDDLALYLCCVEPQRSGRITLTHVASDIFDDAISKDL